MFFGAENEGVSSRMGVVQMVALLVPAAVLVIGAVSMFGVDRAAGRAAEALVTGAARMPVDPAVRVVPADTIGGQG